MRPILLTIFVAACGTSAAPDAPSARRPAPSQAPSIDWQPTIAYLEARSLDWIDHTPVVGQNIDCAMSCHTTHTFLETRPRLGAVRPNDAFARVRGEIEKRVAEAGDLRIATSYYGEPGSAKERESRGTEAIMNAASLALADRPTGIRPITRTAFDRLWEMQRPDGGFDWLDFGLEPWEASSDWGAALAAMTTGVMPDDARTAHRASIAKLVEYVRARLHDAERPMGFHDRIMVLRASATLPEVIDAADRGTILDAIVAKQRSDGGWSLAEWGRGDRRDAPASDAYATAYATLALCEAGRRDARGIAWLVTNRRADGTWLGRSVNNADAVNQRYMGDAATAYAALALTTCDR